MAPKVLQATATISATDNTGDTFARIGAKMKAIGKMAKDASTEMNDFGKASGVFGSGGQPGGAPRGRGGRRAPDREGAFDRALGWGGGVASDVMKGMLVFNVANAIVNIAKTTVKTAEDLLTQELHWKLATGKPEDFEKMKTQAEAISKTYGQSHAEVLKGMTNLYSIVGKVDDVIELAEDRTKSMAILKEYHPEMNAEQLEHEQSMLDKAAEMTGETQSPARYRAFLNASAKTQNAMQETYKPEDWFQLVQKSRGAAQQWSPAFKTEVAPILAQEMRGAQAGTALGAFHRQMVSGKMDHATAVMLDKLGMFKEGAVIRVPATGEIKSIKPGGMLGARMAATDPDKFLQEYILPRAKAKGVSSDYALSLLFGGISSKGTLEQLLTILGTQEARIQRMRKNIREAPGLESAETITAESPAAIHRGTEAAKADIPGRAVIPGVRKELELERKATIEANKGDYWVRAPDNPITQFLDTLPQETWLSRKSIALENWWKGKDVPIPSPADIVRRPSPNSMMWGPPPPTVMVPQAPAEGVINRGREQRFPQFQRRTAPAAAAPQAMLGGKAEMNVNVQVEASSDLRAWATAEMDNRMRNVEVRGSLGTGPGSTGIGMPETMRSSQGP